MTRLAQPLQTSYWPADRSREVLDLTTGDLLRRAAGLEPDRTALAEVCPPGMASLTGAARTDRRWTYAQLLAAAEECAHWLLASHSPGERICVWAPNVPEWIILQYGAALAGLVLVTANPALRAQELRYVLQQSKASSLFYAAEFRGTDMAAIAREVAGEVGQSFCLADWHRTVPGHPKRDALPAVTPMDAAQIQYTSGTTGNPKGALLHHKGLVTNASFYLARAGFDHSVMVSAMPLFHTSGSAMSVLGCCVTRSTLVLPVMFDPALVLEAVQRERATLLPGVPTMLIAMIECQNAKHFDLSSLNIAVSGGAPVPPELSRRVNEVLGCDLITVYGQTELSPVVCQTSPEDTLEDKATTGGPPLPQVEVRIADPATGAVLPIGQEGEIQSRGYQVMLGYFDMPKQTADTIDADGWLRSGDLGRMDARGYVQITGRLKDMIIRGGENIYPAEIEARLLEHPDVVDVAVFGQPDEKWGEVVCAAIRVRPGSATPEPAALQAWCREALAPQKTPARWFVCEAFPLTGSGKVQKFKLREQAKAGALRPLA